MAQKPGFGPDFDPKYFIPCKTFFRYFSKKRVFLSKKYVFWPFFAVFVPFWAFWDPFLGQKWPKMAQKWPRKGHKWLNMAQKLGFGPDFDPKYIFFHAKHFPDFFTNPFFLQKNWPFFAVFGPFWSILGPVFGPKNGLKWLKNGPERAING